MPKISENAKTLLEGHHWSGNVREMGNVIQRALILQSGDEIQAQDIQFESIVDDSNTVEATPVINAETDEGLGRNLKEREYQIILKALDEAQGNRKKVSDKLGISLRTLRYKMAKMRDQGLL